MEYGKIIAVTGMPGLFELLSSKNDGAIVRSLEDKSTKFVSSRVHNFSHLESIEVFTVRENVNLTEIFHAMENESSKVPDQKDAAGIKKYFEKVYPDLDLERVYTSDLKKMAKWFEILKANDVEIKLSQREEPEEEETAADTQESVAEEKPAKKAAEAKTEKARTQAKAAEEEEATAPAKKKAKAKDSSEEQDEKPKKAPAKKTTERKQPDATSGVEDQKTEKKAPAKKSAAKKK